MTSTDQDIAKSERDEQQSFLQRFHELLALQGPAVTLTNIYKEMPVSHAASICEIKGHRLELATCELQLAAISQCKEVYILSPHLEAPILGRLDSMDIRRGVVQLHEFSFAELKETNRKTVRVRFKRPMQIMLHCGADKISGVIHDISLGGCCINTLVRKELKESDGIQVELKLIEPGSGQLSCTSIDADLVQVYGDAPPFRCALSFRHSQQSEQFLSVFIYQRQLEILKELRETL
jgi:PilZ domain-containing protein